LFLALGSLLLRAFTKNKNKIIIIIGLIIIETAVFIIVHQPRTAHRLECPSGHKNIG